MKTVPLRLALLLTAAWPFGIAGATPTKISPTSKAQAAKNRVVREQMANACNRSFEASQNLSPERDRKELCNCVADESIRQGASNAAIEAEAKQIQKDPKYQIRDAHVLAAFQWCSIEMMQHRQ